MTSDPGRLAATPDYAATTTVLEGGPEPGGAFLSDVLHGLTRSQKSLPCKYLYDERGSELFEQICDLDEYYVTRTEMSILKKRRFDIADAIGRTDVVIEPGAGAATKTRLLLDTLVPDTYVPIDISGDYLADVTDRLEVDYPRLHVDPLAGDFTQELSLHQSVKRRENRVLFFPGSTIGNFKPNEAVSLLEGWSNLIGPSGYVLLGVDVAKQAHVLEAAYDDQLGITGRFNLNLLHRINRELDADFVVDQFTHRAVYEPTKHRVEMHIVSDCDQRVTIDGETIEFSAGEWIHTENSHKYPREVFEQVVTAAGFERANTWSDEQNWFDIHLLRLA